MKRITGDSCSEGYGKGRALVFKKVQKGIVKSFIKDASKEIERFRCAQSIYCKRIRALGAKAVIQAGHNAAEIFGVYESIALDEAFFSGAFKRVREEGVNIEYAIAEEFAIVSAHFEMMSNAYMKERAADVKNVCGGLIAILQDTDDVFSGRLADDSDLILVAGDFTPSDVINIDKSALRGLITERGDPTSHMVILAKALGIPVISGAKTATAEISDGDLLLLDAVFGEVLVNPDDENMREFLTKKELFDEKKE